MTIIALAGKAGSGKDTFANVLVKKHGFTRIALADPLRELCASVFSMQYEMFSDTDKKDKRMDRVILDFHHIDKIRNYIEVNWGLTIPYESRENMEEYHGTEFDTPRDILRCVGTSLIRNLVQEDIWIVLALSKIKKIGCKVVITDCRFENEREVFSRAGALLCLIKRNDDGQSEGHEHNLGKEEDYDVVFTNDKTLNEFNSSIDMWYTFRKNELEKYRLFIYD